MSTNTMFKRVKRHIPVAVMTALGSTFMLAPVHVAAQAGVNPLLEEIIVTSRRREESLLDLPLSIAAMTAEQMEVQGVYSIDQAAQFVPNVTLTSSNRANNTRVIIRGIGGGHPDPVFVFGSGMYIDGHYIPNSLGGYMSTMDIERVELLRGPQGTLFGKNVIGGAVNIISTKPQEEFDSSITARLTDDGQRDIRGMLNIPISDNLFARIGVGREEFDGYYKNEFLGIDSGFSENTSGRIALRWLPNDQLTIDVAATTSKKRDDNLGGSCLNDGSTGEDVQWGGGAGNIERRLYTGALADWRALCNASIAAGDFVNASDKITFSHVDSDSVSTSIAWEAENTGSWNGMGLTFKAAHRKMNYNYLADRDYLSWPVDGIGTDGVDGQNNTTDSIELVFEAEVNDRFRFTLGANYFEEEAHNGTGGCFEAFRDSGAANDPTHPGVDCTPFGSLHFELVPNASGGGLWPNGPRKNAHGPGPFYNNVDVYNKSSGVFAHGTFDINDQWTLDFGGRYTEDDRLFDNIEFPSEGCDYSVDPRNHCSFRAIATQATVVGDGFYNTADKTFTAFTPSVSITRNFDNGMVYALYSEGFLTGGFNTEVNSNLPAIKELLTYEPEKVKNYELGFKGNLGGAQISTAVFYMDYTNQQRSQNIANPDGLFGADDPLGVVQNVASSVIYGVEFELRASPWEGGYVSADIGYLYNEYDNYSYTDPGTGLLTDFSNVQLGDLSPSVTANFSVEHTIELSGGATLTPRMNLYYQSSYEHAAGGTRPKDAPNSPCFQKANTKVDARLSYQPANADWRVAAFANNLTDELILENCGDSRGLWRGRYARPQHFGLEFSAHFGNS
ncbi:MAG: TonB-dependent receptor [Proteobacteria bacterium]|jgi:iron complex outermembrane recepter protein|nr:TonB-dependent receptor [Pseudomonadota bacterium]